MSLGVFFLSHSLNLTIFFCSIVCFMVIYKSNEVVVIKWRCDVPTVCKSEKKAYCIVFFFGFWSIEGVFRFHSLPSFFWWHLISGKNMYFVRSLKITWEFFFLVWIFNLVEETICVHMELNVGWLHELFWFYLLPLDRNFRTHEKIAHTHKMFLYGVKLALSCAQNN